MYRIDKYGPLFLFEVTRLTFEDEEQREYNEGRKRKRRRVFCGTGRTQAFEKRFLHQEDTS